MFKVPQVVVIGTLNNSVVTCSCCKLDSKQQYYKLLLMGIKTNVILFSFKMDSKQLSVLFIFFFSVVLISDADEPRRLLWNAFYFGLR
jgi:hypothetical protein